MKKQTNHSNSEQLELMVRTHQAMLMRYLRYLGAQNVEDLAQETFIRAFKATNKPEPGEVQQEISWLRTIARNLFLTQCRQQRHQSMLFDTEVLQRADSVWMDLENADDQGYQYVDALRGCMELLKSKDREALDMRYRHKISREEMAERLAMKPEGVKTKLRRLREILGDCVERKLGLQELV